MKERKIVNGGPEKGLGVLGFRRLSQAVDLGGIGAGAPKPDKRDDIFDSRSSALNFSCLSGRVSTAKATRGLDLDPLGRPLFLGGSAGPRSPWGMRPFDCHRSPHGSW